MRRADIAFTFCIVMGGAQHLPSQRYIQHITNILDDMMTTKPCVPVLTTPTHNKI